MELIFQYFFEIHPSSVTFLFNKLKIRVINIKFYVSNCHLLSLFAVFLLILGAKTVTLQASFSKSHYD